MWQYVGDSNVAWCVPGFTLIDADSIGKRR